MFLDLDTCSKLVSQSFVSGARHRFQSFSASICSSLKRNRNCLALSEERDDYDSDNLYASCRIEDADAASLYPW
jgi:hypothetical protein